MGEKGFCNQVHSELGLVAIVEIDNVRACVKEWVGIGESNRVAIPVTFACRDAFFDHGTTSWQHDLRSEIIVTHFRGDLSVPIVRVNDMGVIKIGGVGGQVFGLKVICSCRRAEVGKNGLIKVPAFFLVHWALQLIIIKGSYRCSADKLAFCLQDLGRKGRARVRARAEVSAEGHFVVRVGWDIVRNITQSNQANSAMWLISAVSPVIIVSGTWSAVM